MSQKWTMLILLGCVPLFFGQACGQFNIQIPVVSQATANTPAQGSGTSTQSGATASTNANQLFSCASGSTYQNGVCTGAATMSSVSLAGANQTTVPFGSGFQKFVYSAALPGNVNFVGLSGKISIDSNSPFFSEALFTVGYSPTGVCPAQGATYMQYSDVFNAMPGAQILQQYIIKIVGGHLELPTNYTLSSPVPVSGCAFVILDGDAGYKGSTDTMTSAVTFNFTQTSQDGNNHLVDAGGGEYCSGLSTGCLSSSNNQFRTVSATIGSAGHLSQLTGSISAAPLYIYKATSLPSGAWTIHNKFYLDPGCSAGSSGTTTGQDFFSQIPAGATTLLDLTQNGNGGSVEQQSVAQANDVDVHAGDCLVQLLQVGGAGPLDIEVQMKANIGDQPADVTSVPSVSLVSIEGETPVYQLSDGNGQNLYVTPDESEIPNGFGLVSTEPVFMAMNAASANSVLLQRCVQGSDHFLSTDPGCEGSSSDDDGPIGYILTKPATGAVTLYRDRSNDYTQVVEQTDATPMYDVQETLGYVGTPTVGVSLVATK